MPFFFCVQHTLRNSFEILQILQWKRKTAELHVTNSEHDKHVDLMNTISQDSFSLLKGMHTFAVQTKNKTLKMKYEPNCDKSGNKSTVQYFMKKLPFLSST